MSNVTKLLHSFIWTIRGSVVCFRMHFSGFKRHQCRYFACLNVTGTVPRTREMVSHDNWSIFSASVLKRACLVSQFTLYSKWCKLGLPLRAGQTWNRIKITKAPCKWQSISYLVRLKPKTTTSLGYTIAPSQSATHKSTFPCRGLLKLL